MPKKKQISVETIEYLQRSINDLLASDISQRDKQVLCIMMEKILKDTKQKEDDFQYLWWIKYGKQEWEKDKEKHLTNLDVNATIKIPQRYITGPNCDNEEHLTDAIQGQWSRVYY
tara:strand:- start:571 stop:915 length:345 start_codon:yes stop_codon:yes gene_type:complete